MAIGTTAAIIGAAALGTAGSLIGGAKQAKAADKAAEAQERAAMESVKVQREGLDFQKQQYQQARTDAAPWMQAGKGALLRYQQELGLTPWGDTGMPPAVDDRTPASVQGQGTGGPMQPNALGGASAGSATGTMLRNTPGYQFQIEEGQKGIGQQMSALGMRGSGAALKALTRFRQGLADQTYDRWLSRIGSLATGGQEQVNSLNSLGANNAANVSSTLGNIGNTMENAGAARASGYVGNANAWSNALGNATNNVSNALGYMSWRQPSGGGFGYPGMWGAS